MGLVLGGLIIPWLLARLGWRFTFRLIGFAALLWVVPGCCYERPAWPSPPGGFGNPKQKTGAYGGC